MGLNQVTFAVDCNELYLWRDTTLLAIAKNPATWNPTWSSRTSGESSDRCYIDAHGHCITLLIELGAEIVGDVNEERRISKLQA